MAHKKATGSTRLGRDSKSQRLGVKIFGDQKAKAGNIIIRQSGTKFMAGDGVGRANNDTLFALRDGLVHFKKLMKRKFTGSLRPTRIVSVISTSEITARPTKIAKTVRPKTVVSATTTATSTTIATAASETAAVESVA